MHSKNTFSMPENEALRCRIYCTSSQRRMCRETLDDILDDESLDDILDDESWDDILDDKRLDDILDDESLDDILGDESLGDERLDDITLG